MKPLVPGAIVRVKGNPFRLIDSHAVVVRDDMGLVLVQTIGTTPDKPALVSRHELVVTRHCAGRSLVPLRLRLPYGQWTCDDGRAVLFNRNYTPIWQRRPGEQVQPADPKEWVKRIVRQEWFFDDCNPPWRNRKTLQRCESILAAWGVSAGCVS